MNKLFIFLLSSTLSLLLGCDSDNDNSTSIQPEILSTQNSLLQSTEVGNFVTTAIQRTYDLDFVFLPAKYFDGKNMVFKVTKDLSENEIEDVLRHFPRSPKDQLLLGSMRGKDIKRFLFERSQESYNVDVETAGLWYNINFDGGFLSSASYKVEGRYDIEDNKYYRIAISDDYYFGSAFPGYKYRNGFNFNFRREKYQRSIREAVRKYLTELDFRFPYWGAVRAQVNLIKKPDLGFKKISEIQGPSHSSPLLSNTVTTRGVVTAVGSDNWYPYDLDIYIQSLTPDNDPKTSEGLHISSVFNDKSIEIGQVIEVTGLVMEESRQNGMGETTLRLTKSPTVIESNVSLPEPRSLKDIPIKSISSYSGNLMRKKSLNLNDGIDFWESLEGMRVKTRDLVVSGFRGGGEDYIEISDRFYLNLYVYSRESYSKDLVSQTQGLIPNHPENDYNPELFVITTNHLSKGIQVQKSNGDYFYYNVGDEISGEVVGVLTYPKNIFGGGEYALVTPEPQESLQYANIKTQGFVPFKQRPMSEYENVEDPLEITAATFNLENLPGNRPDRIDALGEVMAENLKCPDLINLVEIQDNNGISFRESADAKLTLKKVLVAIQYRCPNSFYEFVNVDPFEMAEGGQPGGNIRVAMMYNKLKLDFNYTGNQSTIGGHTAVLSGGDLSLNPGRVFPLDSNFRRSRRSPVMQFNLKAKPEEKIYVIGAHLNSKLGDIDLWGSRQPAVQISEDSRSGKAQKINEFSKWIERQNPEANIIVMGDFNALEEESSLKVLTDSGRFLKNMIFTLPPERRYTTNYNGNSQSLDFIFVNNRLYNKPCTKSDVLQLNSDYMGRISDHDPVVLKICF